MYKTSYSTELYYPAATVWALIRDFNNYPGYIDGVTESIIEDNRSGDEVGATRRFLYNDHWIRQKLGAHSDEHRSLTYIGIEPFVFPAGIVQDTPPPALYEGTMHLQDIKGDKTRLEWSVSVDAASQYQASWRDLLLSLIETWADSLKRALDRENPRAL